MILFIFGGKNVKRIIRVFAFVLVLCMLYISCEPVLFADKTVQSVNADISAHTNLSDYETYLSQNKAKIYDGKPVFIDIAGFADDPESDVKIKKYADKDKVLILNNSSGIVEWNVTVPETALYEISFNYIALKNRENKIEMAISIDGEVPYDMANNLSLPRTWVNEKEISSDDTGNDITPAQVQYERWQKVKLSDINGLYLEPLQFLFHKGENKIALEVYSGDIAVSDIVLEPISSYISYSEYSKQLTGKKLYDGEDIVIQAQNADYKSSKELRPISDKNDPANTPSSAYQTKINCIGGDNWDAPGEAVTWNFNIDTPGVYSIAFNYRQSYLTNSSSVRALRIDDEILFSEASKVEFPYTTDWKYQVIGDTKPYRIYLDKGIHSISLEVSLGDIADISRDLESLVFNIGELYRQIIMITGTSPDANRDYRLYEQIPSLNDNLQLYKKNIDDLVRRYNSVSGAKGGTSAVTLEELGRVLERMYESKFDAHEYVGELFNNYSSVSAWVYEMRKMPLDIEKIVLFGEKFEEEKYTSTFTQRFVFGVKKLLASFVVDYTNISAVNDRKSIDLWVNLGRDQANVLSNMIKDSFTPSSNISVNVKIATATMIQAKLSGNTPDCTILQERTKPVNLAMRGALYDLSSFSDFNDVVKERYGRENIIEPYKYKGGVYGLPDTETYDLMYVRNDIFKQLGLTVPKTWTEFLRTSAVIMRNNLSVGLPQMPQTYCTFLYQFGGKLYSDDLTSTMLQTPEAFASFEYYCDMYREYKLPAEFSFYNRFRTGEMPLGISPHTDYATLMAAAPEITGMWSVYKVPGMKINGSVNDTVIGSGTACIMLNDVSDPDATWEFLKWWTSADTQYRYSSDIESIVGVAARHPTANINALSRLSWSRNDLNTIVNQYKSITDLPQVPGGYYLTRAINNAFYSVYNDNEQPKKMLVKWSTMVDEEMTRKIKEYS